MSLLVAAPASAPAQEINGNGRKQARIIRVPNGSVQTDGQLDEAVWSQAQPVTEFTQKDPVEGAPATERMEVRFVYDDDAVYVGARMHNSERAPIQAPMSRRDDTEEAEYVLISLDTYFDRLTAYTFGVTASGVRMDEYHTSDDEFDTDENWDPVWQARTRVDDEGWTAEFWLPFTQLRFNQTSEMVWGLNIHRQIPTLNEDDYWVAVPRTERGWASRFGELRGFDNVEAPRRIEFYPYVAGSSRVTGDRDPNDPFDDGKNLEGRVGADLKMALGANLTLDATINPDFGQVEADPAEVNLSTFETLFDEKRPFFQEGNRLLQGPLNNFYYSRRIGARPSISASGDYVDYPNTSTILGAAKVTGRMPSGMSIGTQLAVTAEESAEIYDSNTDTFSETKVAPRTMYAVSRVQQEFGAEGSTAAVQFTAVRRNLDESDPLAAFLTRRAYTGAANTFIRLGGGAYEFDAVTSFSYITGTPAAIERVQRNSVHNFQRPDQPNGIRLDPTRTSLAGSKTQAGIEKVTGEHWLWGSSLMSDSPEFETNDGGRLGDASDIRINGNVNYRETRPGRIFRSYNINTTYTDFFYWDRDLGSQHTLGQNINLNWSNYWRTGAGWTINSRGQDPVLTRGGPAMGEPRDLSVNASLSNSDSSQTHWSVRTDYYRTEDGDYSREYGGSFSIRPSPSWELSFDPEYERQRSTRQFVTSRDGGRPDTYGRRYIFGEIERSTTSMQVRLGYTFKPDLNLDFYAEPFAASGRYDRIGELSAARSRRLRWYGESGTTLNRLAEGDWAVTDGASSFTVSNRDFNVRSFRSNLVLRWEWRPGSTLYLVWQQDRSSDSIARTSAGLRSMFGSFNAPGDNFFVVKTTFRLATD
jgi:hypothetical protein